MKSIILNNGSRIPELGFGLWQISDQRECVNAVGSALKSGYRHFDTAQTYGNEAFLGQALADSTVSREELFITTKIWNENQYWDDLIPSFEKSLRNLQTDYVDLLLLHFPVTELRRPAWRKMEELAGTRRTRAIGVSNYTVRHLEELLQECDIRPAVNQVELHVYLQQPELVTFCNENEILIEAYSPLAHGYGLDNPLLAELGKKFGKTSAQIMIRWCIEIGAVPLPKSVHEERIESNVDVFDFNLSSDDMEKLRTLNRDYRTCWDPTNVA